jgi:predicted RNA binding protein YcfA (HicA-like mRNA interferase family)
MPPRVREAARLLCKHGFTVDRPGKGDHRVFYNPSAGEYYTLDGSPSHEMPKGAWEKLKRIPRIK